MPPHGSERAVLLRRRGHEISRHVAEVGWRYFTELGAACDVQVPLDPLAAMRKLAWVACVSANPKCAQFDTSAWPGGPQFWREAAVSGDKKWLALGIVGPGWKLYDHAVYGRDTLVPVNTWRLDSFSSQCSVGPEFGYSTVTLFATRPFYAASTGAMPAGALSPSFIPLKPQLPSMPAEIGASDTVIAADLQLTGGIVRLLPNASTWTKTSTTKLWAPVVVGDDVYADHEYGNNGWSQLVRVDADGSTTVMRAVAQRHVLSAKMHGGWMFWIEMYGDSNPGNFAQPFAEAWAAPYTSIPVTLAQTAKKVAQIDGVAGNDPVVAFDGYYAVSNAVSNAVYVIRASDGAVQKLALPTLVARKAQWLIPAFVSATEVWGIASDSVRDWFVKIQLGPWP